MGRIFFIVSAILFFLAAVGANLIPAATAWGWSRWPWGWRWGRTTGRGEHE